MKLKDKEWREFYLSGKKGIFKNYHGKRLTKDKRIKGNTPLLTAGEQYNGVADFISNDNMKTYKNHITIDMFGNAFFHKYNCTGDDNIYFFINDNLSYYSKLFIVELINKNKTKFSYGKQFRQKNTDTLKIVLPVDEKNESDFKCMEKFTKSIIDKKLNNYKKYAQTILEKLQYKKIDNLQDKKWREFFLTDIFTDIQRGKRLTKANQKIGIMPYVSSTASTNGVDNFVDNEDKVRIFDNCISIANSGSVGVSFYHPYKFVASDHITHLKNEDLNEFIYLFIATQTNRFSGKYNFNREINDFRISREKILLPINSEDTPDYEYMEQYIINVKHKKIKQYLDYLEKQKKDS